MYYELRKRGTSAGVKSWLIGERRASGVAVLVGRTYVAADS